LFFFFFFCCNSACCIIGRVCSAMDSNSMLNHQAHVSITTHDIEWNRVSSFNNVHVTILSSGQFVVPSESTNLHRFIT
jgi:hypothetical protein